MQGLREKGAVPDMCVNDLEQPAFDRCAVHVFPLRVGACTHLRLSMRVHGVGWVGINSCLSPATTSAG